MLVCRELGRAFSPSRNHIAVGIDHHFPPALPPPISCSLVLTRHAWKDLPGFVFESVGGSAAAAAERKRRKRAEKERLAAIAAAAPKPEEVRAAKEAAAAAAVAAAGATEAADTEQEVRVDLARGVTCAFCCFSETRPETDEGPECFFFFFPRAKGEKRSEANDSVQQ